MNRAQGPQGSRQTLLTEEFTRQRQAGQARADTMHSPTAAYGKERRGTDDGGSLGRLLDQATMAKFDSQATESSAMGITVLDSNLGAALKGDRFDDLYHQKRAAARIKNYAGIKKWRVPAGAIRKNFVKVYHEGSVGGLDTSSPSRSPARRRGSQPSPRHETPRSEGEVNDDSSS